MGRRNRRRRLSQRGRNRRARPSGTTPASSSTTGPATARSGTTPPRSPSNDWILALDADERVPPELAAEIQRIMRDGISARRLPHAAHLLLSRALDSRHRLVSRLSAAALRPARRPLQRQARPRVGGTATTAVRDSFSTIFSITPTGTSRDHVTSIDHYTTLAAEEWFAEGRRTNAIEFAVHPRRRRSCGTTSLRRGFRDGAAGFLISILNSYYVFLKVLKLWELQRGYRSLGPGDAPGASNARRRPKFARTPNVDGRMPLSESRLPTALDVFSPHRHGAHVAWRSEPGPRHRAGPARRSVIGRCSSRIPAANCGSARRKVSTSSRWRPRPKWISARPGVCRACSKAQA